MKNNRRLGINHGMLLDTVDMKATIEAQAGTLVGKVRQIGATKGGNDKAKRKRYVRINQPKK